MKLQVIINHIADGADDFLAEASNRAQARAGIEEVITADYASLTPDERAEVVTGVMKVLEEEGFFDGIGGEEKASSEDPGDEN